MYAIPRYCDLDGVTEISPILEGVALITLKACDMIHVRTHNSVYKIFMLDPESGRALAQGGAYFTEPVEVTVSGSTFGGCMLKVGWLGVGFRMEIYVNGQRTVTSPVQTLRVERVDLGVDQFDSGDFSEFGDSAAETHASHPQSASVLNGL
jgi:hypothetical protein